VADQYSKGLIPRNYNAHPPGYLAVAPVFPDELLIPEVEWAERIKEKLAKGSLLYDNALTTPILDQDGYGYCWAHSSTMAVNLTRLFMGEPYVALSAFAVAAVIKNGRDEGGWGAESLSWIAQNGVPSQDLWPQGSASLKYDTPAMRADAAQRKVTEWWDGTDNPDKNRAIMHTCILSDAPCVLDYDEWGHSIVGVYLLGVDKPVIKNSWKGWGNNGVAPPEVRRPGNVSGIVVPRVIMAA
jgi:hypothetical protein